MTLAEIRNKRAGLVAQAREIFVKADAEKRSRTPEEQSRFDAICADVDKLTADIEQRERLDALAGFAANGEGGGIALPHQEARNLGKYSMLRAVLRIADGRQLDGLEGECSAELIKQRGRGVKGQGFVMPNDLPVDLRSAAIGRTHYGTIEQRAAFDTSTAAGAAGIQTTLATTYIELLRNRMAVRQAGARVMTGMHGLFTIPRQSAAGTMYWLAEGGSPTQSRPTVDQVPFRPRTAGITYDITRQLAEQLSTDAEMFVRDDLAQVMARGIDLAALNGTGNANQPLGLMQNPSVPVTSAGTNGGDPTWALVVALETAVATANADMGSLAYMCNAKVRGKMKVTAKIGSTFPIYLWGDGALPLNGYPAYVTNQLPSNLTKGSSSGVCSPLIFGNWSDIIMAFWSGQDIIVDPYSLSTSGGLRIVGLQDLDINIRHPESFAMIVDLTTV